jgi:hypothetical protein
MHALRAFDLSVRGDWRSPTGHVWHKDAVNSVMRRALAPSDDSRMKRETGFEPANHTCVVGSQHPSPNSSWIGSLSVNLLLLCGTTPVLMPTAIRDASTKQPRTMRLTSMPMPSHALRATHVPCKFCGWWPRARNGPHVLLRPSGRPLPMFSPGRPWRRCLATTLRGRIAQVCEVHRSL